MTGPNRSRRKLFLASLLILLTIAAFFLASNSNALAIQTDPSLFLPLILHNATEDSPPPSQTATATRTPTVTPTQTSTPTRTLVPPATPGGETGKVSIINLTFQPAEITVHVGETVEWENNDSVSHTATSDSGLWDSGALAPGQKFSFTFTEVGDYPYHCTFHPFMTGIVHVISNP
jgi:plastocyanin